MSETKWKLYLGKRVSVAGKGAGSLEYFGVTKKSGGERRCGIALDEPNGKHDGSVNGTRYFSCKSNHGVLTAPENVTLIEAEVKTLRKSKTPAKSRVSKSTPTTGKASGKKAARKTPKKSADGGMEAEAEIASIKRKLELMEDGKFDKIESTPAPADAEIEAEIEAIRHKMATLEQEENDGKIADMSASEAAAEAEMAELARQIALLESESMTAHEVGVAAPTREVKAAGAALPKASQYPVPQNSGPSETTAVSTVQLTEAERELATLRRNLEESEAHAAAQAELAQRAGAAEAEDRLLEMQRRLEATERGAATQTSVQVVEDDGKKMGETSAVVAEKDAELHALRQMLEKANAERAAAEERAEAEAAAARVAKQEALEKLSDAEKYKKEADEAAVLKRRLEEMEEIGNRAGGGEASAAQIAELELKLKQTEAQRDKLKKNNSEKMQLLAKKVLTRVQGGQEAIDEQEREEREDKARRQKELEAREERLRREKAALAKAKEAEERAEAALLKVAQAEDLAMKAHAQVAVQAGEAQKAPCQNGELEVHATKPNRAKDQPQEVNIQMSNKSAAAVPPEKKHGKARLRW
eukprot:CAMPEP_0182939806 /NCGR_PEP_ID=MMETSP0105_2-20130417/46236_1 /TAXON_ID=81532 ORGANISM="Acanthoeca-like sp., Strain 10tr" /NCGR_SAMPLE_ID=MMETSP0105_2 /ASSEMBLY_ACC=CAM_ASM_000205 /LENGTH=585 /DNA_ID=CAMNT_0025079247 /DNA_START=164 /DNA_END=1918 /DNA_ORIENTATION=+